jgi:hypothetical protein
MSVAQDTLRSRSQLLRWLSAQCDKNAFLAVGAGAGATAVIVVILHWLQALGLASSSVVLAALPVTIAVIIAVDAGLCCCGCSGRRGSIQIRLVMPLL